MKFHIAQEAFKPKTVSSLEEVLEGFDNLHPTKNAFYIITKPNNNYLQFAGGHERLTAELRIYKDKGFKHFVIGRKGALGPVTAIQCNVGPIQVNQSQILSIDDAVLLIDAFCAEGDLSLDYNLADVTVRFT